MATHDLTGRMYPLLESLRRTVAAIEELLDANPLVPFEITEEQGDALRWLSDNIFT